jgi:YesN/AraC family two-component response regulator
LLNEVDINHNYSSISNLFLYFYNFINTEDLPNPVKYINENFTEHIDLKKLADINHYNVNYYSEWFKHNYNKLI